MVRDPCDGVDDGFGLLEENRHALDGCPEVSRLREAVGGETVNHADYFAFKVKKAGVLRECRVRRRVHMFHDDPCCPLEKDGVFQEGRQPFPHPFRKTSLGAAAIRGHGCCSSAPGLRKGKAPWK